MAFAKDVPNIPTIKLSTPTSIMAGDTTMVNFPEEQFSLTKTVFDYLPIVVLGLESVCGVLCNGAVLLLFCVRKSLMRTASDLFTINLSLVDLIFSGVVLPIVFITTLTAKPVDEKQNNPRVIEIARNCIIIFGTVATALGTLLVSLDRGDVSLKPSKRFFTHSKAIIAIGITWCIATLGLAVAIMPYILTIDERSNTKLIKEGGLTSYIKSKWPNETRIQYLTKEAKENCIKCHPCNGLTIKSCTIQLIFEIPIFTAAILTIIIIYGKILCSVQRRSKKYIQCPSHHNNNTQDRTNRGFCGLNSCCTPRKHMPEPTINERSKLKEYEKTKTKFENEQRGAAKNKNTSKSKRKTFSTDHKKKKQDSLEDSLFVTPCNKQDDYHNSSNTHTVNEQNNSKSKTDFASVAMSVTVVLAIKRMAARKIKERKKKIRHLRKMTFFIVFTFLFCWTPYYISKLSIAMSIYVKDNSLDDDVNPPNATNLSKNNLLLDKKQCYPVWMFNWMLAIAALSCILNPALYIFSREKIRLEFLKTFFPMCSSDVRGSQQNGFTSCLICWDTDENLKEKHETLKQSVITSGWQKTETTTKPNVELQRMSTNGCSHMDMPQTSNSDQIQRKDIRVKAPLIRWEAVTCETPHGSHDALDICIDEDVPNNGLLLPPSHSRPRSLSARSVDVLSCSTTIASLAAEL